MKTNFRTLVRDQRTDSRGRTTATLHELAARCGISRAWLYRLIDGTFGSIPDETVAAIARGLGTTQKAVRAALAQSKKEAD